MTISIGVWGLLLVVIKSTMLLDNVEVTFTMGGSINYVPSSGGVAISGYSLTLGYDKHSWLGILMLTKGFSSKLQPLTIITIL